MVRSTLFLIVFAAATLGCAEITYTPRVIKARVLRSERQLIPADVKVTSRTSGSVVQVEAQRICSAVEVRDIEQTVREEPRNLLLGPDIMGTTFGGSLAGLGAVFAVDAGNVYSSDRDGRLYNRTGPQLARGAGAAMIVAGALIMIGPVIGLVQTAQAKPMERTEIAKNQQGAVLQRGLPCGATMPAAALSVVGLLGAQRYALGATDRDGRSSVDLVKVLPPAQLRAPGRPSRMKILVGTASAGEVDLRELPIDAEASWSRAPAQRATSPEEAARAKEAAMAARQACLRACAEACQKSVTCADACAEEACR